MAVGEKMVELGFTFSDILIIICKISTPTDSKSARKTLGEALVDSVDDRLLNDWNSPESTLSPRALEIEESFFRVEVGGASGVEEVVMGGVPT